MEGLNIEQTMNSVLYLGCKRKCQHISGKTSSNWSRVAIANTQTFCKK